ncbi:MAG: serine--tRNA ligase [Candidatus Aenigmarchaeota archaeon]|nr:serine--tRNA ligase [Candidatus Aenigmarchaeota archaeon]
MLDIKLFRENPSVILESEKKRFKDVSVAQKVIELDDGWRARLKDLEELKAKKNRISKEIGMKKKNGENADSEIEESLKLDEEITIKNAELDRLLEERDSYRYRVGNILHDSVPTAPSDLGNVTVRTWGTPREFDFEPKGHADLVERFAELERAARISGARAYFLKGDLALMNLGLIKLALDTLGKSGFTPLWTPYFIKEEFMKGAAELGDFQSSLYKLDGEDAYMIATSEQSIASFHSGEVLEEALLPIKYAGYSTCFRKEAGSHGKDTKGIFRVHQFDKVEQFILCKPEDSWKLHEELIANAEKIYQALELPYRIVNIASGDMNDNAAKKYDLEAWFPAQKTFRELVSGSNCTDYQPRKLNIRFGKFGGEKEFVHALNCTACATERTLSCILENNQQKDGSIIVPKVLRPFVGKDVI